MSARRLLDERWRQLLGYGSFACFGGVIIAAMMLLFVASQLVPADGYIVLGVLLGPVAVLVGIAAALSGIVMTVLVRSDSLLWLLSALTLSMPILYAFLEGFASLGDRVDGDVAGVIALAVFALSVWRLLKIRRGRNQSIVA